MNETAENESLKLFICSWNVNTKDPNFDLNCLLGLDKLDINELPDIYAIGLQEVNSKPWRLLIEYFTYDPWTVKLTDTLARYNFYRLKSIRLVGILLNVFINKKIINKLKNTYVDWIRLGFFGLWGNKGANICSFDINTYSICLINSHLTAHEHNDKKRVKEYKRIIRKSRQNGIESSPLLNNNLVFFFGDLNFRLKKLDNKTIENKIFNNEYENLLEYDQLKYCIENNECFNDFKEAKIKFSPTYKFDLNKDTYDTSSKKRRPAWCDRILYKLNTQTNNIKINELEYNTLNNYKQSDHRPVYGIYLLNIPFKNDKINLINFEINLNDNNSIEFIYKVNNYEINSYDWIGIYHSNFTHSNDYISFLWASNNQTNTKQYFDFIEFGSYYLAYFSYKQDQIISLSNLIEIKPKQKND